MKKNHKITKGKIKVGDQEGFFVNESCFNSQHPSCVEYQIPSRYYKNSLQEEFNRIPKEKGVEPINQPNRLTRWIKEKLGWK